jgi:hypothetical protein
LGTGVDSQPRDSTAGHSSDRNDGSAAQRSIQAASSLPVLKVMEGVKFLPFFYRTAIRSTTASSSYRTIKYTGAVTERVRPTATATGDDVH